jgi:hypothetical protein
MPLLGSRGAASITGFGGLAKLGYLLRNSLRFRASASAYLSRTPGSASNRQIFTYSGWVKRGQLGAQQALLNTFAGTHPTCNILFGSTDGIWVYNYNGSSYDFTLYTTAVYRDPAAWYHLVVAVDTTQATSSNRVKIYVNGTQITSFTTSPDSQASAYPSLNFNTDMNAATGHEIGKQGSTYFDGYLAEQSFIDGQALTPSSFAKTDPATGQWIPIKYAGTYGTNGFYLNFNDTSNTTAATLGKDSSGNGNNWTPNNFSITAGATYDSMTDVPTLTSATAANYCVGNPLDNSGTLSSGNLTFVSGGSNQSNRASFQLPSSGKFYAECTLGTTTSASVGEAFGYATAAASLTGTPSSSGKYVIYADSTGAIYSNGSTITSSLGAFASGTVLQIAYDGTTGNAWVGKNNTWYNSSGGTTGDPATGANPTFTSLTSVFPFTQGVNGTQYLNFGQQPFQYTAPSGFLALNTYNI